jgi:predicted AlkP superfamily phosphohydrolase/phosphomutase
MGKLVILGLDGATFTLLDPLLADNRLPNLARLARQGVRGLLRSTIHPLTPAAWTSAVAGLNPGKHGIYDFRRRRAGSYALELVSARQRDGQPLWSLLSNQGRRVGVYNVPMTYPPDAVNGFCVSGMDAPGTDSNFVHPAGLRAELLAALPDYQIDLDESTEDEDQYLERVQALAAVQQRALAFLLDRHPDLDAVMAVFVAADRLYHAFWHYLDPAQPGYGGPRAAAVRTVHEQVLQGMDDSLGRLRAWAGDDATIMVISDHGFGPLEKDVFMNRFLLDAGLLRFRPPSGQERALADLVDWEHTRAYSFGFFGNICLNLRGREPLGCVEQGREAEEVKGQIVSALQALRDPASGEPMVSAVYRREELYSGPHIGDAPDLLVIMRDYAYMTRDGYEGVHHHLVGPPMSLSKGRLIHTGNHRLDGVFLMTGPGVRAGEQIEGAQLVDIAPTALYALGVPAPGVMDGHVLRQAFSEEHLKQRPPRRLATPPPPVTSPQQRQLAALARQATELEARLKANEERAEGVARYAQELEQAVAAKNTHIAHLEDTVRRQAAAGEHYQRSIFYRAYQRWQRLFGRKPS